MSQLKTLMALVKNSQEFFNSLNYKMADSFLIILVLYISYYKQLLKSGIYVPEAFLS